MIQHSRLIRKPVNEQGFVSLFTVIFFAMFITIITIGFMRIMIIEQQQALNNDLTASALTAAESGVEDGKRAILKYQSMPSGAAKNALLGALTSSQCNAITNNTTAQSIGIRASGSVTGQANLNQFYTCLTVNLFSPDYLSSASAGKSDFIPLRAQANADYDQIIVSWHLVSATVGDDGDGRPSNYAPSTTPPSLPQVAGSASSWATRGYPAYMRLQLYGYPGGSFTRASISDRSRSVFLIPATVGTAGTTPISLDTADPLPHQFDADKSLAQNIRCTPTPATVAVGTYACMATLSLPSGASFQSTANTYYLRLTPLYGNTHFKVQLKNSSTNAIVNFSEVQPIVDVTGRASDVFRRVQARVRMGNITDLPEYALETANTLCKNMQVSDGSYFSPNNCP